MKFVTDVVRSVFVIRVLASSLTALGAPAHDRTVSANTSARVAFGTFREPAGSTRVSAAAREKHPRVEVAGPTPSSEKGPFSSDAADPNGWHNFSIPYAESGDRNIFWPHRPSHDLRRRPRRKPGPSRSIRSRTHAPIPTSITAGASHTVRGRDPSFHRCGIFFYDPAAQAATKRGGCSDFTLSAHCAVGKMRRKATISRFGVLTIFNRAHPAADMETRHD